MHFSTVLVGVCAAGLVAAHPGQDPLEELLERRELLANVKRTDLSHCAAKFKARGIHQRGIERRQATLAKKAKRGIVKRAPEDINKTHASDAEYTADTPLSEVFAANASCILSPEETEGPYYVAGEYVRKDVTEQGAGIPLVLDVAIFDVETCDPITDTFFEIWHCNSTGVYSGVASGGGFSTAPENINTTFLRGFQKTDADGAVQFDTLYPGHYSGRTHHIHVMVHPGATERENGTILDLTASHVGQMYFDQDLNDQVETFSPYNTNTQTLTKNVDDFLLLDGLLTSDPIMQYVLLGETVDEGVLAWLSFGVNTTLTRTVSAAATWTEGGGVENPNSGPPGGGGPPPGGPGGPPPSSSPSSSTAAASSSASV